MGTLPFLNLTFKFRLLPFGGGFSERNSLLEQRISKKPCFLCKRAPELGRSRRRFDEFRRFSINGSDGEDNRAGSPITSAKDEVEQRGDGGGGEEMNSKQSPASISSREVGHFLAAFPKKVKLGIPFFIPNITLGSFGAITQFKSILPDRRTMVDISLAGPLAGAALSFSMFSVGLLLSLDPAASGDLVQVPSMLFQGSLLLGLISRATLGYAAMHAATVSIHPLVIAGWCGLTTSAFNMLPVGCLDGGRAIEGAFGKNALTAFGLTTYLMLGLGVLGGPLSLPWGLYVLICQRAPEKPCLNNVSEVGTWRRTTLIVVIFLVVLILLPLWDELAEELGIGLVSLF